MIPTYESDPDGTTYQISAKKTGQGTERTQDSLLDLGRRNQRSY